MIRIIYIQKLIGKDKRVNLITLFLLLKKYNYDNPTMDDDYEIGITFFFKTLGGVGSK